MKLSLTLFFALFLCSVVVHAQNTYSIRGSVADTTSASKLANTTIAVLNSKDSTLVRFTRATATGSFVINNLRKGKFILMVTYPDYADYIEQFQLDSLKHEKNFGRLNLKLKSRLLREILVTGTKAAIKIKGDTTEFNASSFVVQPNAKVEDLLKQLPGIQVDKDGKITAQGQTVSKVLVDGEEFFGDDPTLVTKNIRADMVDKVQLYDKKSDQATFTGIDDGVKNKTINIKLKEDKKNGYFGKASAGVGTDQFYQGQGALNIFRAKQKFAVYGTLANTGKTGLGWEDASKYGGANNLAFDDDGGNNGPYIRDELEAYGGNYDGRGIPVARTAGAHYDGKFNADKVNINANYKVGYLAVNGLNSTLAQNNNPGYILNSNSDQAYNNNIFRQKMDFVYQLKLDSLSNLKISFDGTLKHSETNSTTGSASYRNLDTLVNQSNKSLINDVDGRIFNANIFYNKKFKKVGRSFSWSVGEAYNDSKTAGYLKQKTTFYNYKPGLDSISNIDQYKTGNTIGSNLTSNITYSEPFTKTLALIMNYGTGFNHSSADRKSFDPGVTGTYNKLVDSLSNDYDFNQFSNQLGAMFNYRTAKTVFNFGAKGTNVQFDQVNNIGNIHFKRSFFNWAPQMNYQYKFSQYRSLNFRYSGNTSQPNIDQIQPIRNNIDPLNIVLGNPDLRPSFRNNFNMNYNSYKVLSAQSFYVSGNFSFTANPIVSNVITDSKKGTTTSVYSNLTSNNPYNASIYTRFGQKIKGINFDLGLNGSTNVNYNYANSVLNTSKSYNYGGSVGLSKYIQKKIDIAISWQPGYTVSQSSLQPNTNNNGFTMNGYSYFNVYLPGNFEINYDANYEYRAATKSFSDDFSKVIFNTSLSKKFLKESNLKISATVNDLLNQNVGFNRSAWGNYITQNSYVSIKRYFMFSITYDFSKMGGAAPEKK
jgi:hypothetical protein